MQDFATDSLDKGDFDPHKCQQITYVFATNLVDIRDLPNVLPHPMSAESLLQMVRNNGI